MKKNFILVVLFFVSMICKANAGLPLGAYVGLKGTYSSGFSSISIDDILSVKDSDSPAFLSVSAGVRLLRLRAELEYTKRYHMQTLTLQNGDTKDLSNSSVMGNLYYNLLELPFIRLYVNGGIGTTKYDSNYITNSPTFSYSAGAGITITLADTTSLDIGYRYFNMGEMEILNSEKKDMHSNDMYVSIRMGF